MDIKGIALRVLNEEIDATEKRLGEMDCDLMAYDRQVFDVLECRVSAMTFCMRAMFKGDLMSIYDEFDRAVSKAEERSKNGQVYMAMDSWIYSFEILRAIQLVRREVQKAKEIL